MMTVEGKMTGLLSFLCVLILGSSVFAATPSRASGDLPLSELVDAYVASVVSVLGLDDEGNIHTSGSGFVLNEKGDIATCHHVLSGCKKAVLKTGNGTEGRIHEITGYDPQKDLLIATTSLRNMAPLPVGDSDLIEIGDEVVGMGSPPESGTILSSGTVMAVREVEGMQLLQISAPIVPGCSGGPVFNREGKVVGVAVAFLELRETQGFVVPANYLRQLHPVSLMPRDLPGTTKRLNAAVAGDRVVEVLLMREQPPARKAGSPSGASSSPPGTVFMREGKKFLCDRAWKEGESVFLVLHGKRFAIGYHESQIDMKRSFVY